MYVIDYALTPIETIDGPAPAGPVISTEARRSSGLTMHSAWRGSRTVAL